jgi:DNA-binding transcriptional LysR family regulator
LAGWVPSGAFFPLSIEPDSLGSQDSRSLSASYRTKQSATACSLGVASLELRLKGELRINATLGFGRSHVAPLISQFVPKHPKVEVQLQLSVNPPPLADNQFDVWFRFGHPPDLRAIARFIAPNRRLLVASPAYLKRHGTPATPGELARHNCIGIRQGDEAYGQWRFTPVRAGCGAARSETMKIRGNVATTTNDGGIAVNWALEGHGILLRAQWDVERYLASGRLVQVLKDYGSPEADIHAVYGQQHRTSVRVRALVEFVAAAFAKGGEAAPAR